MGMGLRRRVATVALIPGAIGIGAFIPGIAREASAQVPPVGQTPARPASRAPLFTWAAAFGFAADDNLFQQPVGTSDVILRFSPSMQMRRDASKLMFAASYRFDAERYTEHQELTAPFARQAFDLETAIRPNTRTTLTVRGGYNRTRTAQDLNVLTGLATGRVLTSQSTAGARLSRRLGVLGSATVDYDFAIHDVTRGVDTRAHAAQLRLARRVGARDEFYAVSRIEYWQFDPGDLAWSQVAVAGWSKRLTPLTKVEVEGGPRWMPGRVRPDVRVSIGHEVAAQAAVLFSYSHRETMAVGLAELVEVDGLSAVVRFSDRDRWEAVMTGGAFRNVVMSHQVFAYDVSATIDRAISRSFWISAAFNTSFNSRRVDVSSVIDQHIRRNSIALSVRVAPWRLR